MASEYSEEAKALGERFTAYTIATGLTADDIHGALRALQALLDARTADLAAMTALASARAVELTLIRQAVEVRKFDDGTYAVNIPSAQWDAVCGLLAQPPDQHGAAILTAAELVVTRASGVLTVLNDMNDDELKLTDSLWTAEDLLEGAIVAYREATTDGLGGVKGA